MKNSLFFTCLWLAATFSWSNYAVNIELDLKNHPEFIESLKKWLSDEYKSNETEILTLKLSGNPNSGVVFQVIGNKFQYGTKAPANLVALVGAEGALAIMKANLNYGFSVRYNDRSGTPEWEWAHGSYN